MLELSLAYTPEVSDWKVQILFGAFCVRQTFSLALAKFPHALAFLNVDCYGSGIS
jgi:hypothetical protein